MQDSDCASGSYHFVFDPGTHLSNRMFCLLKTLENSISENVWSSMNIGYFDVAHCTVWTGVPLLALNFEVPTSINFTGGRAILGVVLSGGYLIYIVGFLLCLFSHIWSKVLLWWIEGYV